MPPGSPFRPFCHPFQRENPSDTQTARSSVNTLGIARLNAVVHFTPLPQLSRN
jgi:hypothetical protein